MSLTTEIDALTDNLKNVLRKGTQTPDPYSSQELQNNELRRLGEELKDLRQDRDERKSYASKLYWLVLFWLLVILIIVVLQGLKIPTKFKFQLDTTVLITLITTTTANVAAFFLVVVRYLFRPKR